MSRQASRATAGQPRREPAAASTGKAASAAGPSALQEAIARSPRMLAQRQAIAETFGHDDASAPVAQLNRTAEERRARQKANQERRAERRDDIRKDPARGPRQKGVRSAIADLPSVLPRISPQQDALHKRLAATDETSWGVRGEGLVLAKEGVQGPFDEDFGEGGTLMWRSDTRPPKAVLKTGFTTKAERDLGKDVQPDGGNEVVYRTGPEDIVPATGVCLARDVRGACFFPFQAPEHDAEAQEESAYLYGVRVRQAVNTFKAQQIAERAATGDADWRDPARFAYDPNDEHDDDASAVWPYAEYVTHRVEPEDVVAAYRFTRDRLVAPDEPGREPKAGIGFRIGAKNLVPRNADDGPVDPLRDAADLTAAAYGERYPRHPDHYLSYQGTVRRLGKTFPQDDGQAADPARVSQIDALPSGRSPRPDVKKAARRRKLAEKKELKQRGIRKDGRRPGR